MGNAGILNLFNEIKNQGRVETPHAWALDNAELLAEGLPVLLDTIEGMRKQLEIIYNENQAMYDPLIGYEEVIKSMAMTGMNLFKHAEDPYKNIT